MTVGTFSDVKADPAERLSVRFEKDPIVFYPWDKGQEMGHMPFLRDELASWIGYDARRGRPVD